MARSSSRAEPPDALAGPPPEEALLCAMVLAPQTYARNRFFRLFENPQYRHVRTRAKRLRGLIRELLGSGSRTAEVVGTQVNEDRVLLRLQVPGLNYERTTSLSLLESALVNYALSRARGSELCEDERSLIQTHLRQLGQDLVKD